MDIWKNKKGQEEGTTGTTIIMRIVLIVMALLIFGYIIYTQANKILGSGL